MTVVQLCPPTEPKPPAISVDRLLAAGTMTATRPRLVVRAERWATIALAVGGALGLAYHILAPALVAGLKVAILWLGGE